jgi:DNA (cytosine-5)-methyltransferase 1
VWTGSCPCQPFSMAGEGKGTDDPRHLWPAWFGLIKECRPATIFGEQSSSLDGLYWLDLVYAGLEAEDYAIGTVDISGACIGSPDIRPRLWFVANADRVEFPRQPYARSKPLRGAVRGNSGRLEHAERERAGRSAGGEGRAERTPPSDGQDERRGLVQVVDAGIACRVADHNSAGLAQRGGIGGVQRAPLEQSEGEATERRRDIGWLGGFWAGADWIWCRPEPRFPEGCWRPIEPGSFPLATGIPARILRVRGYGNSIKPWLAKEVIAAYMAAVNEGFVSKDSDGTLIEG